MKTNNKVKLLGLGLLMTSLAVSFFLFHQKRLFSSLNHSFPTLKREFQNFGTTNCMMPLNVTENDFQMSALPSDDELTELSNGLPVLFQSFVNVDESVKQFMNNKQHEDITRDEMLNYFEIGRIWKSNEHSTINDQEIGEQRISSCVKKVADTPFRSLVIPTNYLVKNYEQVKTILSTTTMNHHANDNHPHHSYILRHKDINSFWDNDYSTILENKARKMVGDSCWNSKLVFFSPMWQIFHSGGPQKVGVTLMSALKFIRKPFKFIYNISDPELLQADVIYSYNPYKNAEIVPKILQALEKKKANPNLHMIVGPVVALDIVQNQYSKLGNRLTFITASHWVKSEWYGPQLPNSTRIEVLPTAINTKLWSPNFAPPRDTRLKNAATTPQLGALFPLKKDVLLYLKNCPFDTNHVRSLLKQSLRNSSSLLKTEFSLMNDKHDLFTAPDIYEISYEHKYSEEYFWNLLRNKIRFAVVCTASETQGIALQEIMSMNIPLLVLWKPNKLVFDSNSPSNSQHDQDTNKKNEEEPKPAPISVPYFVEGVTGMICTDLSKFSHMLQHLFIPKLVRHMFQPRKVMVDWFNYFDLAVEFLKITCSRNSQPDAASMNSQTTRFETFSNYLNMVRNIQHDFNNMEMQRVGET
ncbi:hypothetical protein C9374_001076 [Naegleria lovaniensis]|uniref:Uncharacterized protein n=1 Tax=Naegleria lovaniensis TaxID=51637 RepID=A0AA88KP23_NAELO|nr:uncharacterized protein C9374_001076 [Naegleria lovaniensis]KAG2388226.1 hypothetical protein C9374_001076 [Naegleria lovaniensis]